MKIHRLTRPRAAILALALSAAALSASALAASPAAAQPAGPPAADTPAQAAASEDERAAKWLSAGNKAFKEGKLAEAERAYREAFAIKKGYDIAGNLGAALLSQGKLREAGQHFAFTLRNFPITGDPAQREQMQKAFDQCRQGVGAIRVSVSVKGARVSVDGAAAGETPLLDEVFVDPGDHVIEARLEGYKAASERVTARKGEALSISIVLEAIPVEKEIVKVVPPRRRSIAPALVMGGAAALGVGAGIGLMGLASARRSDAEALRLGLLSAKKSCVPGAGNFDKDGCASLKSRADASDTFHNAGISVIVVGGVAAAGAVSYLLWPSPKPRSAGLDVQATPLIGAGVGGLSLSGAF